MQDKELLKWLSRLEEAASEFGLRLYPIHFDFIPSRLVPDKAAYGCLQPAYPLLEHAITRENMRLMKNVLQALFVREMVQNTNPVIAYLVEGQELEANVWLAAHVLGHVDFFANNVAFQETSPETIAAERSQQYQRVVSYIENPRIGEERVKGFIEALQSMMFQRWRDPRTGKMTSILLVLREKCPRLGGWHKDLMQIVDAHAAYALPGRKTLYTNEGWAVHCALELIKMLKPPFEFMRRVRQLHYSLLYSHDAEEDDEGKRRKKKRPLFQAGLGDMLPYQLGYAVRQKVPPDKHLEVRRTKIDSTLMEAFLTQDLGKEFGLLTYRDDEGQYSVQDTAETNWEIVKQIFIRSIGGNQFPDVRVIGIDGATLYLRHFFEGRELDTKWRDQTLKALSDVIWRGKVVLETVIDAKLKRIIKNQFQEIVTESISGTPEDSSPGPEGSQQLPLPF